VVNTVKVKMFYILKPKTNDLKGHRTTSAHNVP